MFSRCFSLIAACLALLPFVASLDSTRLVYEFPNGTFVENIAVRSSGSVLTTIITSPDLYLINPLDANPRANLVHRFPSGFSLLGITETTPDTFFVVVSNFTVSTASTAPGSNTIFRVAFDSPNATATASITHVATIEDAKLLNGLTTLNNHTILAADSGRGQVWSVNTDTGVAKIVISDPLMAPTSPNGLNSIGINGLHLRDSSTLFFTNTAQALLAKIHINLDGIPKSPATLVARSFKGTAYDDFALSRTSGNAFLATGSGNSIARVNVEDGNQRIVAGNINSTDIAEPTSAAFGRTTADRSVLYVTTAGGLVIPVNGDEIVGGQLVAVSIRDQ
ncbi:hypothetical protein ACLMJK_005180 [Lecanora helva]